MFLKRTVRPQTKRNLKKLAVAILAKLNRLQNGSEQALESAAGSSVATFNCGDWVRVRSKDQIKATLNLWGELNGCSFMPDMWNYCGSVQRVLKPVRYFIDERDYRRKRCSGVVLLEGVICEGLPQYGPCDRSCFFFWREEWLEALENKDG
ncbi:MAG: hypothetical protein GYB65_08145 [Chloroflexi bacterium]|nr:hypothetical protein [Chloroflexota bacterium]